MRLAIMGAGAVGRAVAELAPEYGHTVVALGDSSGAVIQSADDDAFGMSADDDGSRMSADDHASGSSAAPEGLDVEAALSRKREQGTVGVAEPESVLESGYDVLVEATPTTLGEAEPGFGHVKRALERDRHVVLANKGPVAERYDDVMALAERSDGAVRFEAAVGGAIPIISTIEGLGPSHVEAVRGVLNGTANFLLTRMAAEGLAYEDVLAEAQDLGVAEADPSFDVEGTDAALKCVILANVLAGGGFELADATVEGIAGLPTSALEVAAEDGRTIRLIGEVTPEGVKVGPRLVPEHDTLAVTGTMNIVQFETEYAGRLNISGRGAGGMETASAVLADVSRLA